MARYPTSIARSRGHLARVLPCFLAARRANSKGFARPTGTPTARCNSNSRRRQNLARRLSKPLAQNPLALEDWIVLPRYAKKGRAKLRRAVSENLPTVSARVTRLDAV